MSLLVAASTAGWAGRSEASPAVARDASPSCTEAAFALASHSYVVSFNDCSPGSRTWKAAKSFQKSNGLFPDGIVGPVTWAVLVKAADASAQAARIEPPNLTGCAEVHWFMDLVGLPHTLDFIPPRESGCDNTQTSYGGGCCVGWFQIAIANKNAPGYRAGFAFCGVATKDDMRGDSYEQKLAQVCVAKVLYDVWQAGGSSDPWRL